MFHGHLDYFQKPPLGGRPNTKLVDHGNLNTHNRWFIPLNHVWGPTWIKKFIEIAFGWRPGHTWLHTTLEGPWPHYMILEVCWDGLWTLSFGLSQFHGHGSWLVCEVALTYEIKGPWSLHFEHSHWWKKVGRSKFTSHHARGITRVSARWM